MSEEPRDLMKALKDSLVDSQAKLDATAARLNSMGNEGRSSGQDNASREGVDPVRDAVVLALAQQRQVAIDALEA